MESPDDVYHIVTPHVSCGTATGERIDEVVKGVCFSSGIVMWELRLFLKAVLTQRKTLDLSRLLRDNHLQWQAAFDKFQLGGCIHASLASCKMRNVPPTSYNRSEYHITTIGLLVLLLHLAVFRDKKADRDRCSAMLEGWLTSVQSGEVPTHKDESNEPTSHLLSHSHKPLVPTNPGLCRELFALV